MASNSRRRSDSGHRLVKNYFSLHRAYLAAIAVKALDGALETIAGAIIAVEGSRRIYWFVIAMTAPEIARDPDDRVVHAIRNGASTLSHSSDLFVVTYLLIHGILKLAIAINLLRGSVWIFPFATAILAGLIAFMGYRLTTHYSGWLLGFTLLDTMTLALVLNEWRTHRAQ